MTYDELVKIVSNDESLSEKVYISHFFVAKIERIKKAKITLISNVFGFYVVTVWTDYEYGRYDEEKSFWTRDAAADYTWTLIKREQCFETALDTHGFERYNAFLSYSEIAQPDKIFSLGLWLILLKNDDLTTLLICEKLFEHDIQNKVEKDKLNKLISILNDESAKEEYVIDSSYNGYFSQADIQNRFKRLLEKANIK